ncbi:hypothetical protein ACVIIV_005777 [Bradyrhizobium sp. USDA 4354]
MSVWGRHGWFRREPIKSKWIETNMCDLEKRALQRIRYGHGQMLRSLDFRDQLADTAQHRWWHNRALHDAYGVYQGLTASAIASGGALVGLNVTEGVGVDCFGRELIVDSPQRVPVPVNVPPVPVTLVLLIRYEDRRDCHPEAMEEICWATSGTDGSSTVSFKWMPLERTRVRDGVPLAQVIYDATGKPLVKTDFVPPGARPLARPGIATGATLPAKTAWEPWTIDVPQSATGAAVQRTAVGVQTRIDTSAAGFRRRPCYFAWLAGPLFNRNTVRLLPDMFSSLTDESANGFTFRMWFPPSRPVIEIAIVSDEAAGLSVISRPDDFFPFALQQKLYVQWVACEMPETLPYVPMRLRILNKFLLPLVLEKVSVGNVNM